MKSFYVTLPSNASMQTYPNNTLSHYFTTIHKRIALQGQWECGLSELHYIRAWLNIKGLKLRVIDGETVKDIIIPDGYYETAETLIETMNILGSIVKWENREQTPFEFEVVRKRVHLTLQNKIELLLPDVLRDILGFRDGHFRNENTVAVGFFSIVEPDMTRGMSCMYIYTNIIEPRIVGDTTARLLRVIPAGKKQGESVMMDMKNIQYMDVTNPDFDTVEILICDETGKKVPFTTGRVVVTLHFREKNTL